jgi:hypothetical protein
MKAKTLFAPYLLLVIHITLTRQANSLKIAGGVCVSALALAMFCLLAVQCLIGADIVTRRTMIFNNFATTAIGIAVLASSFYLGAKAILSAWLPYAIGAAGGLAVILSIVGLVVSIRGGRTLTIVYLSLLILIFLSLAALCSVAFAKRDEIVSYPPPHDRDLLFKVPCR